MTVYTYYEPIFDKQDWLLEAWAESWRRNGWEPVILCRYEAMRHPKAYDLVRKTKGLPTVNPRAYEEACYVRWLAMAQRGGLMVDYDVINIDFPPMDFGFDPSANVHQLKGLTNGNPACALVGTKQGFQYVVNLILSWDPAKTVTESGRPHISDMEMLATRTIESLWKCDDYPATYPLVHAGTSAVRKAGISRRDAVAELMKR